MNQIPNIEETHNTEVEKVVKEFERCMPLITSHGLLLEARLTPTNYEKMKDWLRTTLHQELQKAREEERLIVKKAIENINKVDAWYDHDLATLEDHHAIKMARSSYDDLMEWLTPKNEKSSNKN